MSAERVLLIDDDIELCELIAEYLELEDFVVEAAHSGKQGVEQALSGRHTFVVLDLMLPGIGGFEALRRIRLESNIPVLMLTARGEEIDRILGLEYGADDYMHKPFHPRELIARIRAILRRSRPVLEETPPPAVPEVPETLAIADIVLDRGARMVRRKGVPIALTSVEFDLLAALMKDAGRVLTRDEMMQAVFGRKLLPLERGLDMHVSKLRRKLGDYADGQERIRSIRSVGYIYTLPDSGGGDDA